MEGNQNATHVRNEPQVPQSQKSLKHTRALLETEAYNISCWSRNNIIGFKVRLRVETGCNGNEISLLYKSTDQAVKMTGLITGSRKANKTHMESPESTPCQSLGQESGPIP